MARVGVGDRRADADEVIAHRDELRQAAAAASLTGTRLRDDGTIIIHSDEPDYGQLVRFATSAARIVGTCVHVITDDVPAAEVDAPAL